MWENPSFLLVNGDDLRLDSYLLYVACLATSYLRER